MKNLEIYITVEVRDKYGQLTFFRHQPANSLVKGFLQMMYLQSSGVASYSMVDTGGTSRACVPVASAFQVSAPDANSTYGIRVGTGTNPVTIDDINLQTMIAHGTAGTQLYYKVCNVSAPAQTSTTSSFTVTRLFQNSSGGNITINECGLVSQAWVTSYVYVLIDRTLMTFTIVNGGSQSITYTFIVTV